MLITGNDSANNKRKSLQYVIINPLLEKAREKISKNGKAITIRELMKNGAKGKKIRVIC